MSVNKEDVISYLENLTLIEASELVKDLEEKFGVSAAAPVATVAAGPEEKKEEEKTEFNVVLEGFGDKKISVIRKVKELKNLNIVQAKALIEEVAKKPVNIKENVSKEEAEKVKQELITAGAQVKIV
jgi:large subunit ribosomal protein L7/L12